MRAFVLQKQAHRQWKAMIRSRLRWRPWPWLYGPIFHKQIPSRACKRSKADSVGTAEGIGSESRWVAVSQSGSIDQQRTGSHF